VRYTKDKKDYTYFRSNPDGSRPSVPNCFANPPGGSLSSEPNCLLAGLYDITGQFKGDRWDWRAVGDYRFTPNVLAYVSVSTGFKGGGVNPRPFTADQRLPFNPETLTTYEAGFKSDLLDRRMRVNGAVFFNKYKDIILAKTVCNESVLKTPCLRPDNIGAADVQGAELEVSIYPAKGLSFDASAAYLDFKYTSPNAGGFLIKKDPPNADVVTSIPVDAITPYTPELSYAVGGQYGHDLGDATVTFRLDGSYQGKIYTTAENTSWSKMDGRFLANARLSWAKQETWKVSLEVQNLFNKYYYQSVSDASTSLGIVSGVPGLPRTFSMAVERKF
jgi:iron complex outermembrane recepter protein